MRKSFLVAAASMAGLWAGAASASPAHVAQAAKPAKTAAPVPSRTCHAGESSFFRDEGLTIKLTTKLQFNKQLMREKINVKVNGGVATLSGGVSTPEHIAEAMKLASEVEGITCVNNFLRVGPPDANDGPGGPRG